MFFTLLLSQLRLFLLKNATPLEVHYSGLLTTPNLVDEAHTSFFGNIYQTRRRWCQELHVRQLKILFLEDFISKPIDYFTSEECTKRLIFRLNCSF